MGFVVAVRHLELVSSDISIVQGTPARGLACPKMSPKLRLEHPVLVLYIALNEIFRQHDAKYISFA